MEKSVIGRKFDSLETLQNFTAKHSRRANRPKIRVSVFQSMLKHSTPRNLNKS